MRLDLPAKSLRDWEPLLTDNELYFFLVDAGHDIDDVLTPEQVFDILLDCNGAVLSAYQIKCLIGRVYGVWL